MKSLKCLFFFPLFLINYVTYGQKIISVTTIDEFFDAVAPNVTIELAEGNYDISKLNPEKKSNNVKLEQAQEYDPINWEPTGAYANQLIIIGVSNLKIIGKGAKPSKIYTPSSAVTVLTFKNCKNITINNIDAGHKAKKGDCSANVIDIIDCETFSIKNSILYGSGYEGIRAMNVKKLFVTGTTITDCSYMLLDLVNCMNTSIDSCTFTKTTGGINIMGCLNLTISNSEISDNTNESSYESFLFDISRSTNIKIVKLKIEHNKASYLARSSQTLIIDENTEFNENSFYVLFKE